MLPIIALLASVSILNGIEKFSRVITDADFFWLEQSLEYYMHFTMMESTPTYFFF